MEKKEYSPQQAALLLLSYLHSQPDWSACIDGFSTYLSEHYGIGWERTEFLLYHIEREGLIVFLGKDRYWIQMTAKGNQFRRMRGITSLSFGKMAGVIGGIIGAIGTILTIIELLTEGQ